jgi:hypothetical protein
MNIVFLLCLLYLQQSLSCDSIDESKGYWLNYTTCTWRCKQGYYRQKIDQYSWCEQCDQYPPNVCSFFGAPGFYYIPCLRDANKEAIQNGYCEDCYNRPSRWYSTYTGGGSIHNVSNCAWICNAGYYRSGDSCVLCPGGSVSAAGASSAQECVPCIPGKYIQQSDFIGNEANYGYPTTTVCRFCTFGKVTTASGMSSCYGCGAGFIAQYSSGLISSACWGCNTGKYSTELQSGDAYDCKSCSAGTFSLRNASTCTACPIGTYSLTSGSSKCTSCDSGTYASELGSSGCTNCDPGSYAETPGKAVCDSCATGSYATASGSIGCERCDSKTCYWGQYLGNCGGSSAGECKDCLN